MGPTKRGKGTKLMAVADGHGLPVAIDVASASPAEVKLVHSTLDNRFVDDIPERLIGDRAYDSAELRQWLSARGTKPVVPNKSNRKQPFSFDRKSYKQRHRIENAFCRLKDFRRIATRYDRLARNFLASVCLVASIVWWIL